METKVNGYGGDEARQGHVKPVPFLHAEKEHHRSGVADEYGGSEINQIHAAHDKRQAAQ